MHTHLHVCVPTRWDTASTWSQTCVHPDASASGPAPGTPPISSLSVTLPPTAHLEALSGAPAVKAAEPRTLAEGAGTRGSRESKWAKLQGQVQRKWKTRGKSNN